MKPGPSTDPPPGMGVLDALRAAARLGINHGTSGNASIRALGGFLITPSGRAYDAITDDDLVHVDHDGQYTGRPSSEWHFHGAIYAARPDVGAVLHLHSPAATALATLRLDLPPFHYMVAIAGGDRVRCTPYTLFGTEALSALVVSHLEDRHAVLLGNHGLVATGASMDQAFAVAQEIEGLCDSYLRARAVAEPALLTPDEMDQVQAQFDAYRKGTLTSR